MDLARSFDFDDQYTRGSTDIYSEHRFAHIKLLDPGDEPPNEVLEYDPERTLIHELLHIHLHSITGQLEENDTGPTETVINILARALLALKRRE